MTEMTEKEGQGAKIRKGLSARRDSTSYQLQQDVVIPAGTILRSVGDDRFAAPIGFGDVGGEYSITAKPGHRPSPAFFKAVISS